VGLLHQAQVRRPGRGIRRGRSVPATQAVRERYGRQDAQGRHQADEAGQAAGPAVRVRLADPMAGTLRVSRKAEKEGRWLRTGLSGSYSSRSEYEKLTIPNTEEEKAAIRASIEKSMREALARAEAGRVAIR